MISAGLQLASQLVQLLGRDALAALEERAVQLRLAIRVDEAELGHVGVELQLHPLEEDRVVDHPFRPLPAKPPIAQHQLHPLALEIDLPLQLVEPLEDAHGGPGRLLGLGPPVPGDPVLLQRGDPRRDLGKGHGDRLAAAHLVPLAQSFDATIRIVPAWPEPVGDLGRRPRRARQRRAPHPKERRGVTRVVALPAGRATRRELHLADDDAGMFRENGEGHRPRLVGQPALDGEVPLGERLEEAEDLLRALDLGRNRTLRHPPTRPPSGGTAGPSAACRPRVPGV
jgi:hypothetical protein